MSSCNICIRKFNNTKILKVICPNCNYIVCSKCYELSIIGNKYYIRCLDNDCKYIFDNLFINRNFSKTFIRDVYKNHIKEILYNKITTTSNNDSTTKYSQFIKKIRLDIRNIKLHFKIVRNPQFNKYYRYIYTNLLALNVKINNDVNRSISLNFIIHQYNKIIYNSKYNKHIIHSNTILFNFKTCPVCQLNITNSINHKRVFCIICNIYFCPTTNNILNKLCYNSEYNTYISTININNKINLRSHIILTGICKYINNICISLETYSLNEYIIYENLHDPIFTTNNIHEYKNNLYLAYKKNQKRNCYYYIIYNFIYAIRTLNCNLNKNINYTNFIKFINKLNELIKMTNKEFIIISKLYNCKILKIIGGFRGQRYKDDHNIAHIHKIDYLTINIV